MELRYRVLESPVIKLVQKLPRPIPFIHLCISISRSWVPIRTGRQRSLGWRITPPIRSGKVGIDGSKRTGVSVFGTGVR